MSCCNWSAVVLTIATGHAAAAKADTIVQQTVEATIDGKTARSQHEWSLSGHKFHLQVTTGDDQTHYIFNGRTLYACGKLNQAQLASSATRIQDVEAFAPYKDGACQVAPTNFMVRFFLSPMPSVESVDRSDGLKLTFGLKDYDLSPTNKDENVLGRACTSMNRQFTIIKSKDSGAAATTTVKESFCQDTSLSWREGLGLEVNKAAMRQMRGADVLRYLKRDGRDLSGLVLRADSHQTIVDRSGASHHHHFLVSTTAVRSGDLPARLFQLPVGYKLFSDDSATLAAAAAAVKKAEPEAAKDTDNMLEQMSSAFFCALSGPLACLAGP